MSAILPINVDALLHQRTVESERVEFKGAWDPVSTGPQVIRTICAFANDFHNLNGGYVVIGVDEEGGHSVMPPRGLSAGDVDAAQRWIRGRCNRLDPPYPPVLSPEWAGDRLVLVVWAPASEMRPHRAPARDGSMRYWVRLGSETVDAERRGELLRGLIGQTAKVPWDDRRAGNARIEDLRETKVREYLRDVSSGLVDAADAADIYARLRITARVNDHEVPRNVGLLLFAGDPQRWFRGATIDVVQFAGDRAGNVQEERTFRGPLLDQLPDCLRYLENLSTHHVQKRPDRVRAEAWVSYPMDAVREALVNAAYHRSYDVDQPEPTKVYLYPNRIEVVSYPGPVSGIEPGHLRAEAMPAPVPARNRRIGEFLKDLRLAEGRLTGIPKIFNAMRRTARHRRGFSLTRREPSSKRSCPPIRNSRPSLRCGMHRTCGLWARKPEGAAAGWRLRGKPLRAPCAARCRDDSRLSCGRQCREGRGRVPSVCGGGPCRRDATHARCADRRSCGRWLPRESRRNRPAPSPEGLKEPQINRPAAVTATLPAPAQAVLSPCRHSASLRRPKSDRLPARLAGASAVRFANCLAFGLAFARAFGQEVSAVLRRLPPG